MNAFVKFLSAGAVMLAATVGTCFLLQEDMPPKPVYSGEVGGRLSEPSRKQAAVTEEKIRAEEAGTVSDISGKEAPAPGRTASGNAVPEAPTAVRAGIPDREADAASAAEHASVQDADRALGSERKTGEMQNAAQDAILLKGQGADAAEPVPAADELRKAVPSVKTAESSHPARKAPQAKRHEQHSDKARTAYDKSVTSASFSMNGNTIRLTLKGNAPMVGHYFMLKDPERIVLDLAGSWDVSVPPVPSNRLIRSVRTGRHEDKTRLVFDMKSAGKAVLVPLDRNSLELSVR